MIENNIYITSKGKHIPLHEMAYPHLLNAYKKAKTANDLDVLHTLEVEIDRRLTSQ